MQWTLKFCLDGVWTKMLASNVILTGDNIDLSFGHLCRRWIGIRLKYEWASHGSILYLGIFRGTIVENKLIHIWERRRDGDDEIAKWCEDGECVASTFDITARPEGVRFSFHSSIFRNYTWPISRRRSDDLVIQFRSSIGKQYSDYFVTNEFFQVRKNASFERPSPKMGASSNDERSSHRNSLGNSCTGKKKQLDIQSHFIFFVFICNNNYYNLFNYT